VGTSASPGTVVVGGGVIGMSIAFELASAGMDCTVVDPSPGRGASWAAAGMLSHAAEVAPGEAALLGELTAASGAWPAFAARVASCGARDVGYSASGSILVGLSASDAREAARFAALATSLGVAVEALSSTQLAELEPSLVGSLRGGWTLPDDHSVDNRRLVEALLSSLKSLGVSMVEDRCVRVTGEQAGVRCTLEHRGALVGGRVVLATGAAAPILGTELLGMPSVRPVRGVTLRLTTRPGTQLPDRAIRAIVDGVHCYLVPRRDGELVVGATSEEQGYELDARAGGVFQLLDAARRVLPCLDELVLDELAVGLRPATADHLPFVGLTSDPRIVAALGHYRNGILLAPLTARRVVELLEASPCS
jgi:glycine oxidase